MKKFISFLLILCCFLQFTHAEKRYFRTRHYHNNKSLEDTTDLLVKSTPFFQKVLCKQDESYRYMQIGNPNNSLHAIITCNLHARELITAEACLSWMKQVSKQPQIWNNFHIKMFYAANKNREKIFHRSTSCIRKDQFNVDTNRNFPTDWNHLHLNQSSDLYPGKAPLDQPISQCIEEQVQARHPDLYFDLHSGEIDIYYQPGINNQKEIQICQYIQSNFFHPNQTFQINTLASIGETINGCIFADLKVRKQVQYSFLMEIFKGPSTIPCFLYFNPEDAPTKRMEELRFTNALNYVLETIAKNKNITQ